MTEAAEEIIRLISDLRECCEVFVLTASKTFRELMLEGNVFNFQSDFYPQ